VEPSVSQKLTCFDNIIGVAYVAIILPTGSRKVKCLGRKIAWKNEVVGWEMENRIGKEVRWFHF